MQLQGQVALVTGGSRGIGRATALAFAGEGADIAFCHLNDDAQAEATATEIRAFGRRALHLSADVADPAATRDFARQAANALGPPDILFNNAGMNTRKPFEDYTEAEFDRLIGVHLKGMFFMAQAVYSGMVARERGCIINVASQMGLKGGHNAVPYCAAKAGIIGLTRALAWEAAPKGVRVNAIAPGQSTEAPTLYFPRSARRLRIRPMIPALAAQYGACSPTKGAISAAAEAVATIWPSRAAIMSGRNAWTQWVTP